MLKINGKTITDVIYKGKRIQRIMVGRKKYYDMYDGKICGYATEAGSISVDGKTYSYGVGYFEFYVGELRNNSLRELLYNKKVSSVTHIGLDTRRVTSWYLSFATNHLTSLNLSGVDTKSMDSTNFMFQNCSALTTLDVSNFNTQNVTTMSGMFKNCSALTTLDVSNFNTQNVTTMNGMFYQCSSLTTLDVSNFNTQNVTTMSGMFLNCSALTTLDVSNFNTQNVTTMSGMFFGTKSLKSLILANNFDMSGVTNTLNMFSGESSLVTITGCFKNLAVSLNMSSCPLDHDSAMRIINGLATVTTSRTLTLRNTTKNLLSATEKAILINKGWTLA